MKRDKKIDAFIEFTVMIISALSLFIIGWILQDLILGQPIKITLGLIIIAWAIAVILLLIVAFVTDVMRKKNKISTFLQIITISLAGIALYISGSIIQNMIKGQSLKVTFAIGVLSAVVLFLIILGAIVELTRKKS